MSFEFFFLCRGFTNSLIDMHKSNLELSHLFGTTSFDSYSIQNQNLYWKMRKMQTNQDIIAYYLKNEILILRTLNELFLKRYIFKRIFLRKVFLF